MKNFERTSAGKNHKYYRLFIADLAAEYVNCPLNVILYWYKKIFYSFIAQTVLKESVKDIPLYTESDLLSNDQYNQVLIPLYMNHDYNESLRLFSAHLGVSNKVNLGSIYRSQLYESKSTSSNSQLKWYMDLYNEITGNFEKVTELARENMRTFEYMYNNGSLKGRNFAKQINKKLDVRSSKVLEVTNTNLKVLDPIQKTVLKSKGENSIGFIEHDYLMQRGYAELDKFTHYQKIEESDFETMEQQRFNILINAVFIFSKAGRLDVIDKYAKLEKFRNLFDKQGAKLITKIKVLIKAIELYQNGKWISSVTCYLEFLKTNFELIHLNYWIRLYETTWYLAVVACWGSQYHVYLPVNALNFVFEECKVKNEEDENESYRNINQYERIIDVEPVDPKAWERLFTSLLSHFKIVYEENSTDKAQFIPKILVAMFNMIGTLIINCEQISHNICNNIEFYITLLSQIEVLQNANIEKFLLYFNDKRCCDDFKNDFFDIDDFQKNDTLYYDADESTHNQYLVMLIIKADSDSPKTSVAKRYDDYCNEKSHRIIAHCKLTRLLRLKIKNFNLKLKTDSLRSKITDLTMQEFNWVCLSDHGDIKQLIYQMNCSDELQSNIKSMYVLQRQLFNILCNHYSIRNSLDTHFVVGKLDEINKILLEARLRLTKGFEEIAHSKKENSKNDESFNPFIEIDEENKEAGFVDFSDRNEKIQDLVNEVNDTLKTEVERLSAVFYEWIDAMPEPESLNIGVKQQHLNRKLRWEKMITSKDKIKQLQGIFRMLRKKKSNK